jgi:hypothetical protein
VSPVPTDGPVPHPPAYHTQLAPTAKEPDEIVSIELSPPHMADGVASAEGATEPGLTLMVKLTHVVVSQAPSALT